MFLFASSECDYYTYPCNVNIMVKYHLHHLMLALWAFSYWESLPVGIFLSSLTESQVVAAVITFIVFFFTLFMDGIAASISTNHKTALIFFGILMLIICFILWIMMRNITVSIGLGIIGIGSLTGLYMYKPTLFDGAIVKLFSWLSATARFNNFYMGILDLADIIFYISIIFVFLFLSTQVIKKKRWS